MLYRRIFKTVKNMYKRTQSLHKEFHKSRVCKHTMDYAYRIQLQSTSILHKDTVANDVLLSGSPWFEFDIGIEICLRQ